MKHLFVLFAIFLLSSLSTSFFTFHSLSFQRLTKGSTLFVAKPSIFRTKIQTVNQAKKSLQMPVSKTGNTSKLPSKEQTIKDEMVASDDDDDDDDDEEEEEEEDDYEDAENVKEDEEDIRTSVAIENRVPVGRRVQDFSSYPLTRTNDGNYWINEEYGSNQTERGMIWNRHKHLLIVGEKGVTSTLVNGALNQIKHHNYIKVRVSYYDLNSTEVSFQFLNNASLPESVQLNELADVYEVRHQGFMLIRRQFLPPKVWTPRVRSNRPSKQDGKRHRSPKSSRKSNPLDSSADHKKKFSSRKPLESSKSSRYSVSPKSRSSVLPRKKSPLSFKKTNKGK
jgi:RNA-binding protein YhbY